MTRRRTGALALDALTWVIVVRDGRARSSG